MIEISKFEHCIAQAQEHRAMASVERDPDLKDKLLKIAQAYEGLALYIAERREPPRQ